MEKHKQTSTEISSYTLQNKIPITYVYGLFILNNWNFSGSSHSKNKNIEHKIDEVGKWFYTIQKLLMVEREACKTDKDWWWCKIMGLWFST